MRVLVGVLVALFGAVAGAAIGVSLTYALFSGEHGADAFTWFAAGLFVCLPQHPGWGCGSRPAVPAIAS